MWVLGQGFKLGLRWTYGESFSGKSLDRHTATDRGQKFPETVHSHLAPYASSSVVVVAAYDQNDELLSFYSDVWVNETASFPTCLACWLLEEGVWAHFSGPDRTQNEITWKYRVPMAKC